MIPAVAVRVLRDFVPNPSANIRFEPLPTHPAAEVKFLAAYIRTKLGFDKGAWLLRELLQAVLAFITAVCELVSVCHEFVNE